MVQETHEKEHAKFDTSLLSLDTAKFSFEVRIKYTVLVVGLLLTTMFSYGYVQLSPPGVPLNDTIRNIVLILGAGIGLTSLVYTALSVNAIRADKVKELYTAKLIHSSQFVSAWYSESMVTNTTKIRLHNIQIANEQEASEKARLIRELVDNQELFVRARTILNFLEHMAQDISFKLGDEHYLRTFFNHIVHGYYHSLLTIIEKARRDERSLVPFCEVEALAKRWN